MTVSSLILLSFIIYTFDNLVVISLVMVFIFTLYLLFTVSRKGSPFLWNFLWFIREVLFLTLFFLAASYIVWVRVVVIGGDDLSSLIAISEALDRYLNSADSHCWGPYYDELYPDTDAPDTSNLDNYLYYTWWTKKILIIFLSILVVGAIHAGQVWYHQDMAIWHLDIARIHLKDMHYFLTGNACSIKISNLMGDPIVLAINPVDRQEVFRDIAVAQASKSLEMYIDSRSSAFQHIADSHRPTVAFYAILGGAAFYLIASLVLNNF